MNHHHDPIHHLNTNRKDDLLAVVRSNCGHPEATAVRADHIDPEGIDVTITTPGGTMQARVPFPEPIEDFPAGVRLSFVRLVRRAREATTKASYDRRPEEA